MSGHRTPYDHSVADWVIPDPGDAGTLDVSTSGYVELVSAAAETRTLNDPKYLGQWLVLGFKTDGGDITLTCTNGLNVTANNTITFDTAGEMIMLMGCSSGSNLRWRALACVPEANTASLSTV